MPELARSAPAPANALPTYATGQPVELGPGALRQRLVVTASLSGHNTGLVARLGDWTWDLAHRFGGVNPYRARTAGGAPSYLSFCALRLRACGGGHLRQFELGAELDAMSQAYRVGPGALFAVHRLAPRDAAPGELDLDELAADRPAGALYAETYNRWIAREAGDSNEALVRAAPPGFDPGGLPLLPPAHHPRAALRRARATGSFAGEEGWHALPSGGPQERQLNPCRDINGVDLLYFASYAAIVDEALLVAWEAAGGDRAGFLARRVQELRIAYFANLDPGSTLRITPCLRARADGRRLFDAVLTRAEDDALVAVATLWLDPGPGGRGP